MDTRISSVALTLSLICAPISLSARESPPLYIGVMEDALSEDHNLSPGMSSAHVRIAFQKRGEAWVPMKTDFNTPEALSYADREYPRAVKWRVLFSGKQVGAITSKSVGPIQSYGDVGTQTITTNEADIPKIAIGASDFGYTGFTPRTRPLLLVSGQNFGDTEAWKRTTLSNDEREAAIKEFRKKIPSLEQCDTPEQETPARMVAYEDDEILFIKAYRSRNGALLFGLKLNDARSKCEYFDDEHFFDYWFSQTANQQIRLLGSQMIPIDAADLDGSGHSVWIFHTSRGEDEDGYELFYNDFTKKASFHWTYH